MKFRCNSCNAEVSSELPENSFIDAWISCVDCLRKDLQEASDMLEVTRESKVLVRKLIKGIQEIRIKEPHS